jgi:hypothetical protein
MVFPFAAVAVPGAVSEPLAATARNVELGARRSAGRLVKPVPCRWHGYGTAP